MVMDARPTKSAMMNSINGAGMMVIEHYPGCERIHLGIENIHNVRHSYLRIFELMAKGLPLRTAKMEAGWMQHFETIMLGVQMIVEHLERGVAVLVHCSDGWDRTAQLVSLAQICLASRYRTIEGLIALIEREWLQAGHQFEKRLARKAPLDTLISGQVAALTKVLDKFTGSNGDDQITNPQDEFCPIFPQFLDCLLQLMRVYPQAFEYNRCLLNDLWREGVFNRK